MTGERTGYDGEMGRDALGTRPFRILLAIVVVAAGLAAAGLVALDDLPRWVRPLVLGASVVLAAAAALGAATAVAVLAGADDPRRNARPTGGQVVGFTRLDGGAPTRLPVRAGPTITIGSAAWVDLVLDGDDVEGDHARVRVFDRVVDVDRVGRGRVRVDGRGVGRGSPRELRDGAVLTIGRHRLRVDIGWEPDPDDPKVGTRIGRHRLMRRLGATPWGTRYLTADGVLDRLDQRPLTDDELAAYATASAAAHERCPTIAGATTTRDADGTPVLAWTVKRRDAAPLGPAEVLALAERLAPLHAAGAAHGALTASHLLSSTCVAAAIPPPPAEASPRVDVFALATLLAEALVTPPHSRDAPAWAALLAAARSDAPAARPADATALARAILRAAAVTDPRAPFAGHTFAPCPACGEHLVAVSPAQEIMFDGVAPDGTRTGGSTTTWPARCLACDHDATRVETVCY